MTVVLWDEDDNDGLVVVSEAGLTATYASLDHLRFAKTVGELRAADLQPWARRAVDTFVEIAEDEGATVSDDTPWEFDSGTLMEETGVPSPIEFAPTAEWLGEDFLGEHADYVMASSPMDTDKYRVRDRDAFLAALEARGFTPQRRPGLMDEFRASI